VSILVWPRQLDDRLLAEQQVAVSNRMKPGRALYEIALILIPYLLATKLLGRIWPMPYWGPVAVITGVLIATLLMTNRWAGWHVLGLRRPAHWGRTIAGVVAMYVALAVATTAAGAIIRAAGMDFPDHGALRERLQDPLHFALFVGPVTWIAASFGEEMLLRGFVFSRFEHVFGSGRNALVAAVLAQALLFGWLHRYQGDAGVILVSVYGAVAGGAYLLARRNLWVVILCHGLVDTISLTAVRAGVSLPG